jgi:hypothetical protein
MAAEKPGYDDTEQVPGQKWRVHDNERPLPRVVQPPTESSQQAPGAPPSDAVVLFDGADLSGWVGDDGSPAAWKVENGYMEVVPKSGSISSKAHFGDCQLHLEWAAPAEVVGDSQGRGNSGVFLMGRYEIQVLDSYDNPTYADGGAAGVYGQYPPLVNACRKPGEWQTYDIVWIAPRFDGEELATPARLTLLHNGLVVHHDVSLTGPTTHRKVLQYEAHPATGPLGLQDHGNPVRYRNIWYRPLKGYDEA